MDKLAHKLYPRELIEKVGVMDQHVVRLTQELEAKEEMIKGLEEKVRLLEDDGDNVAQYSRRASIQVRGMREHADGENTDALVLGLFYNTMGITPPIELHQIARSHRLGRRVDGQGRPRERPIIVRFIGERVRDEVYRARTKLKDHND